MSTAPIDLSKMSAAEIKAFIESQNAPTEEVTEQPRDEQGRFVSTEEAQPTVEETQETQTEAEPVVVEREIDFEDGSGIQVFRGVGATETEAYAALADVLTKAQMEASRKIKELSRQAVPTPVPPPAPTPENEFLLAQQLIDNPQATLDRLMAKKFAEYEAQQQAAREESARREQQENAAANSFMAANPDYYMCPQNGARLEKLIALRGFTRDQSGIQAAYDELKADGLLVQRPEEPNPVRPRASGLSTRSSSAPPARPAVDLNKLTLEQLRELSGGYQERF